jgi:phage terminase small subunit
LKIPADLKTAGRKFWRSTQSTIPLSDPHDAERLHQACCCLDEIEEAKQTVQKEGRYISDRFQQRREHPAAKTIRDATTLFCRIVRDLGLDLTTTEDNRPPRRY